MLQKSHQITMVFLKMQKLIQAAKFGGADAVKLQTYSPKTMIVNSSKNILLLKMVLERV